MTSLASAARATEDKARVDANIISSKGKLKLKEDINAAATVSEFVETTVIPQLFSEASYEAETFADPYKWKGSF